MKKPGPLRIVYVVDSDPSVREGLSRLMDSANLEARPYACVSELLRQSCWMHVACILLDVSLLRDCDVALRSALHAVADVLPVIALSADDDSAASSLAREVGARSFFHKPVDAAALLDAIEWAMQNDGQSRRPI